MLEHSTPAWWVLAWRCDELTYIAKLMPFFVHDTFLIGFIALGFWRRRHPAFFLDLILLVCLTTLLNNGLKGFFHIPRPDVQYHLLPLMDPWGFPSGDAQQITVFWTSLWAYFRKPIWGILAFILIPLVMLSRLYLGVHSGPDVLGGMVIGLISVFVYKKLTVKAHLTTYFVGKPYYFWSMVGGVVCLYALVCPFPTIPLMIPLSLGALIGYGLSLPKIGPYLAPLNLPLNLKESILLASSLLGIITLTKIFPSFSSYPMIVKYPFLMGKLAFIVWLTLVIVPWVQDGARKRFLKRKIW